MKRCPLLVLFVAATLHTSAVTADTSSNRSSTPEKLLNTTEQNNHNRSAEHEHGLRVISFNWHHVELPFIVGFIIVICALVRLGYHYTPFLPDHVPESCILIILGIALGGLLWGTGQADHFHLTPNLFFLGLLPPTILDASYALYDRTFVQNLPTILLFAVVGTLLNCFIIGPLLYGLATVGAMGSISISTIEVFVFSSLIVAVDPVAVLAIFQEIGVNETLYFVVFGESLLNDAVTVVLYRMMTAFHSAPEITAEQVLLGVAHFLVVVSLGTLIGVLYGVLTCLLTRITKHVAVLEPLFVIAMAYMAYITSDLFELSGIISMIVCGLVQARYAFVNITHKSRTTTKTVSAILSGTSDSIIFMFLGLEVVVAPWHWHTGFVLWTLLLTLVVRGLVVLMLTALANTKRLRKINLEEQFIMAYGGLRGAVCFSLVVMLGGSYDSELRKIFVTTTLIVIFFTVFLQGLTIKPFVKLLHIRRQEKKNPTILGEIHKEMTDNVMAATENIIGRIGFSSVVRVFSLFEEKYVKPCLQKKKSRDEHILQVYEEIALEDHYHALYGSGKAQQYHEENTSSSSKRHMLASCLDARINHELGDEAAFRSTFSDIVMGPGAKRPWDEQEACGAETELAALSERVRGTRRRALSTGARTRLFSGGRTLTPHQQPDMDVRQHLRRILDSSKTRSTKPDVGLSSTGHVHNPVLALSEKLREKRRRLHKLARDSQLHGHPNFHNYRPATCGELAVPSSLQLSTGTDVDRAIAERSRANTIAVGDTRDESTEPLLTRNAKSEEELMLTPPQEVDGEESGPSVPLVTCKSQRRHFKRSGAMDTDSSEQEREGAGRLGSAQDESCL